MGSFYLSLLGQNWTFSHHRLVWHSFSWFQHSRSRPAPCCLCQRTSVV